MSTWPSASSCSSRAACTARSPAATRRSPTPKALAAFCFKLADAFEKATDETPRRLAEIEAANKAAVKLDEVDLSSVFAATSKPAAPAAAAPAPAAEKK
jgi:hypothetical protein